MNKKEKFNCDYCGAEILREVGYKAEHHFCDQKCQFAYFHEHYDYIIKHCELCGKEMKLDKHSKNKRFCSIECTRKWYSKTMSGENAARYNSVTRKCSYCGKDILVCKNRLERSKHYFCDNNCQRKWYSEIYSKTEEHRERNRISSAKALADGKMPFTMTKPHRKVCEFLEQNDIAFVCEYQTKYYCVDVQLPDTGLMIEVMGDYWHTNPLSEHILKIDEKRKDIIRRDRSKHSFIKNNYGIEVLYLWETDIDENEEVCVQLIKLYIKNDGVLDNYDSFNYHIQDGKIVLNDIIVDSNITSSKE